MMMEEWDIVQTIQFLLSASQQIYLAQVTERIFKPFNNLCLDMQMHVQNTPWNSSHTHATRKFTTF